MVSVLKVARCSRLNTFYCESVSVSVEAIVAVEGLSLGIAHVVADCQELSCLGVDLCASLSAGTARLREARHDSDSILLAEVDAVLRTSGCEFCDLVGIPLVGPLLGILRWHTVFYPLENWKGKVGRRRLSGGSLMDGSQAWSAKRKSGERPAGIFHHQELHDGPRLVLTCSQAISRFVPQLQRFIPALQEAKSGRE